MAFYDEFKQSYETTGKPPSTQPSPQSSSPYQRYPPTSPIDVDPEAPTEARYPTAPPPPHHDGGNSRNGDGDNRRGRRWWIIGAIIVVLIVVIAAIFLRPGSTTTLTKTATPTLTATQVATQTPLPTATALPTATSIAATTVPATACPPAPSNAGTLASMTFFTIPGIPAGSVVYYSVSEDSENNHIQARTLHVCSSGTPTAITQTYMTAFIAWATCGTQCWRTTFVYDSRETLTKTITVQAMQPSGGVTTYQLALTLDAAITKMALPITSGASIGFTLPTDQDATWQGSGHLAPESNTIAAPASECTSANLTYSQLRNLDYSGHNAISTISQDPNQPTIICFQTNNGGLVDLVAYYTTSNQTLILSYTSYVTGFA